MADTLMQDITLMSGDMNITDDLELDGTLVQQTRFAIGAVPTGTTNMPIIVDSNNRAIFDIFSTTDNISVEILRIPGVFEL